MMAFCARSTLYLLNNHIDAAYVDIFIQLSIHEVYRYLNFMMSYMNPNAILKINGGFIYFTFIQKVLPSRWKMNVCKFSQDGDDKYDLRLCSLSIKSVEGVKNFVNEFSKWNSSVFRARNINKNDSIYRVSGTSTFSLK